MRIHIGYLVLSFGFGFVLLAILVAVCYFAVHQQVGIISGLGHTIAFFISLLIFFYCGADCQPPVAVVVVNAIFDVMCLSFPVYLILLSRHARRTQV